MFYSEIVVSRLILKVVLDVPDLFKVISIKIISSIFTICLKIMLTPPPNYQMMALEIKDELLIPELSLNLTALQICSMKKEEIV